MAQILVPGVAQAKLQGVIGVHPWNAIWHYQLVQAGGVWTAGQLGNLAEAIATGWNTYMKTFFNPEVVLDSVSTVDIGVVSPAVGQSVTNGLPGTGSGFTTPPQATLNIRYLINARYRGGHPHTALPAMDTSRQTTSSDAYTSAAIGLVQTAFANLQDAVFSANPGINQCVPRYTYTYTPSNTGHKIIITRTGLKGVFQVLNWVPQGPIGTQRRRNRVGG